MPEVFDKDGALSRWRQAWGSVEHRCPEFDQFDRTILANRLYYSAGLETLLDECEPDLLDMPSMRGIVLAYIQRSY